MPKRQQQRIIDSRRENRSTTITGVTVTAPASGVSSATAGDGLTFDGAALNVGAGTLVTVGADSVGVTAGSTYQFVGTGSGTAAGWRNVSELAGAGLTATNGVLVVGAGTLVTVGADTVGITTGSTYQFIGTGSGTSAAWQNMSTLAGAGLTHTNGVLEVGAGSGITINADDVALTTPGTLTVSTTNSATGSHTHAITASADVTAGTSALLKSASGDLKLYSSAIAQAIASNATFASGFAGSGWQVDYGVTEASKASAEFDNLTIRGRMRVYELLIQQIRATNGSVFVSSSSKVYTTSASANPLWTVNGSQLTFNGSNANLTTTLYAITTTDGDDTDGGSNDRRHYHGFLNGDIIRAQQVRWDGSSFSGIIQSNLEVTGVTNLYTYQAAMVSGDAPAVGYDYVRLGSATSTTRQGSIYLTSDDSNAPFIDIVDTVRSHADWNTAGKIKTRVGKLTGITDSYFGTLSGYGMYSDNVYLRGNIYATSGYFKGTVYAEGGMFNGSIVAADGTIGGWTIGSSTLTGGNATLNSAGSMTLGTSNDVLIASAADATYRLWIGNATAASAKFSVTKGGALSATDATISGAITANSGSLAGFLTIGASGGIYQGTGTSGTPTDGLKIFRSGDVGQLAVYDGGAKTLRITNDDVRMYMATYDGDYDDYRTIRWLPDVDGTDSARTSQDYRADIVAFASSGSPDRASLAISSRVNAADYDSREARVDISAINYNGSTSNIASLLIVQQDSTTSYNSFIALLSNYLYVTRNSAPSATPASGYCLLWVDSATNTLKMKDSGGTTRSVTFS